MITQEPSAPTRRTIAIPRRHNAHRIRRAASIVAAIVAATVTWLALTDLANIALQVPSYGGSAVDNCTEPWPGDDHHADRGTSCLERPWPPGAIQRERAPNSG